MKTSLRFLAAMILGFVAASGSAHLMAADEDSPMYGIGEPQSAVPPAFRQSTAPADVAMTKKVADALQKSFPDANLYITTTADHTVYLRGFTQGATETTKIVAAATKLASPAKVKNDLRVDMFARPGPMNGPQDK